MCALGREPESEKLLQGLQLAVADYAKGEAAEGALTKGSPYSALTEHAQAARARAREAMDKSLGKDAEAGKEGGRAAEPNPEAAEPSPAEAGKEGGAAEPDEAAAEPPAAAGAAAPGKRSRSGAHKPKTVAVEEAEPALKRGPGRPPKQESLEQQVSRLAAELAAEKKRTTALLARAEQAEARATAAETAKIRAEASTAESTALAVANTKLKASFFMLQAAQGRLGMPGSSSDESTPTVRASSAKPTPTALEAFFEM